MSIDPLKTFASVFSESSRLATAGARQQPEQSFNQFLKAAETASLSTQELAREAAEIVQTARLQMMQGLFDLDEESSDSSLFSRLGKNSNQFALQQGVGQKLDSLFAHPVYQPGPRLSEQSSRGEIEQMIDRVAKHVSLAPELIRSVVRAESDFTPDAVSSAGARGLMQLMPATAEDLGVKDSFDPLQNLLGGSRYLKQLLDKYDGDLDHALAAYNWGQGNVDRKGLENMPQETRDYLLRVKGQLAG